MSRPCLTVAPLAPVTMEVPREQVTGFPSSSYNQGMMSSCHQRSLTGHTTQYALRSKQVASVSQEMLTTMENPFPT